MNNCSIFWNDSLFPEAPNEKQLQAAHLISESCFLHNCIFNIPQDTAIAPAMKNGIYELYEINQLKKILHPSDVFIDVGACVGLYTVVASKEVGEQGSVIAIEPNDCSYLKWNIEKNDCRNVLVLNNAAGDQNKIVHLEKDAHNFGNTLVSKKSFQNPTQMLPIDEIVGGRHRVSAIKIDVQGYEIEVLRGASKTIKENKRIYLLVEFSPEHIRDAGYTTNDFFELIYGELGFRVFIFDVQGIQKVEDKLMVNFKAGYKLKNMQRQELFEMSKTMDGFINLWLAR